MMITNCGDFLKCDPKHLLSRPKLVKPDRDPDFIYERAWENGHIKYSYWFKERVFEFYPQIPSDDDVENYPSLYFFMFDPVWGIFTDDSYAQDNHGWSKELPQINEALKDWMLEKEIFDD